MSTRGGKALGVMFVLIGAASLAAGYKMQVWQVFVGGLVVFGLAAYLLDSSSMKEAVKDMAGNAGEIKELIDGRRATDTKEVQISVKKDQAGD